MEQTMTLEEAHRKGFDLVREHTTRFVDYIDALSAAQIAMPVRGSCWTAGEVVTHVQSVYERYTIDGRRAADAADVAVQNGADVERLGVDVAAAGASIRAQVEALAPLIDHVEPAQVFPFHAGLDVTLAGGWGNLLGELLAHGDDIARATGSPFEIPGEALEVVWRFTSPLLAGWMRPEAEHVDEVWSLQFPFGPIRFRIVDGSFRQVDDGEAAPANHDVSIDDVSTWTLTFPYRRRAIDDPAVALLVSRFFDL